MNNRKPLERLLRWWRYRKAVPWVRGPVVVDVGCNDASLHARLVLEGAHQKGLHYIGLEVGELADHVDVGPEADTVVCLATIEHMPVEDVWRLLNMPRVGGRLVVTTPAPRAALVLEALAWLHLLDRRNIREHRRYWSRCDLLETASSNGYHLETLETFQAGFNQLAVLRRTS